MAALSVSNGEEETAYLAWLGKNPLKYGRAGRDAFLAGYRAAKPSWVAMTTAEQLTHIETCWSCALCADGRTFGACTSCGKDPVEALPSEGLSRCCGSVVTLAEVSA